VEDDASAAVMMGALCLGNDDPRKLTTEELRRVTAYLRAQRNAVRSYWRDEMLLAAQLESGTVTIAAAYPTTWTQARALGADVGYTLPTGARLLRATCVAIPSASTTTSASYGLIAALLSPSTQTHLVRKFGCFAANLSALPLVPAALREEARLESAALFGHAFTIPEALEHRAWVQAWFDARAKAG